MARVPTNKIDYSGGMFLNRDASKLDSSAYWLLVNGRSREGVIRPVKLPQQITELPAGNYQGIYGAGSFLLVFIDGQAYYKDFTNPTVGFNKVVGISMDATVDTIYAELVPASFKNYGRIRDGTNASAPVLFTSPVGSTPRSVVVQDGTSNNPQLIFPDGTARTAQTYDQWSKNNREYVPRGSKMLFHGGILYIVTKDANGVENTILRSVSGRPLDFMVNITTDGDKSAPGEREGGAITVSHRVSFDEILAINRLNTEGFYVSTGKASWLIIPDFANLIFGEPQFSNRLLFDTGSVNQFSLVDVLGDTTFVDINGIRSFNAITQLQNTGRHSPFSKEISPLFNNLRQTISAAIVFDNYAFYAVDTIYGAAIAVYDTIIERWVAIDIYPDVGLIKQLAEIKVGGERRLFFITTDNKIYEAFASSTTATCRLYSQESSSQDPKIEQKVLKYFLAFTNPREETKVQVTVFSDRKRDKQLFKTIPADVIEDAIPNELPFKNNPQDINEMASFDFSDTFLAFKHGFFIEWNGDAELTNESAIFETQEKQQSTEEIVAIEPNFESALEPVKLVFTADDGWDTDERAETNAALTAEDPTMVVGAGDHIYQSGTLAERHDTVDKYWDKFKVQNKLAFALGNHDLDTNDGKAFLDYFENPPPERYFELNIDEDIALFVVNSGKNTAGAVVEPDGVTSTSVQACWLETKLKNSTRKFKLVVFHHPPFTSEATKTPGDTDLRWPFKEWGASIVINGHAHVYERLFINNLTYVTIGNGGRSLRGFADTIVDGSVVRFNDDFGYLFMKKDAFNLNFSFKTRKGVIVDSFTIFG